jgi:hypothetical protein
MCISTQYIDSRDKTPYGYENEVEEGRKDANDGRESPADAMIQSPDPEGPSLEDVQKHHRGTQKDGEALEHAFQDQVLGAETPLPPGS